MKSKPSARLGKINSMNSAEFNFLKDFPPNLSIIPPNLDSWTCKLEITSKMSSFQPVNDAKYVNSMVISCSTCEKEEKECIWVKYLIYAVLSQSKICSNLRTFSAKSVFPKFQSSQKNIFSKSVQGQSVRLSQTKIISNCLFLG